MSLKPILGKWRPADEAAAILDRTRRTLDRWHALGIGPPRTMVGRSPYYADDSLEQWLRDREQKATA